MPKNIRKIPIIILSIMMVLLAAQPAFADAPKTVHDEVVEQAGSYTPEYFELSKAWSNYFLDLLPNSSQPEALKQLTHLPAYDDVKGWKEFFHDGDPILMRDEAYRVAKDLGVTDKELSLTEKANRITDWTKSGKSFNESVFNRNTEVDGYVYDCTTVAEGLMTIGRIAGIPAISVPMTKYGELHEEAFFYVENTWSYMGGNNKTFNDFFSHMSAFFVNGTISYDAYETSYGLNGDMIIDVNEPWIDQNTEMFMLKLLRQPFAYPNQKLTRGEVAKLLCNYTGIVPMRNEQVFSDTPTTHQYAPYVWAMHKLGIMSGNGDGAFAPDRELSMQEFSVIASRLVAWGKAGAEKALNDLAAELPTWEFYELYTEAEKDEIFKDYKTRIARFEPPANSQPRVFADSDKIASWAKPSVDEFSRYGILEGDSAGATSRLNPTEALSKTRFLVFMFKFQQKFELSNQFGSALF